ncbi:trifunctional serine/threonine-protein kinase/ATP-binding protein/sensor histidine kinase [Leptolyngbya sp. GB1-A1]|uniref:trifunctional serine/threonine-protein kinase/ATP-binding protein/sensor histidine kinase n=1 Tax=Leptolyngbya sp. GB1-A1 TaxID=2933908 RepID=UPI003299045C
MDAIANLSGYAISELLYSGSRTLVYRGVRESDQHPVVIKLLRNPFPSLSELVQFRNQYTIAKNLDLPGIIQPLALEFHENAYALVMEDFGAVSLSEYRKTEGEGQQEEGLSSFSLPNFLSIALQLSVILDGLSRYRVIHKDIKPANILIHPVSKQVKLIDFSIASLLPRESQEIQNPNMLEGTLAYLSPEQTGRMNRGIDYRSDLYSLGVTFYELLTGQLPFVSADLMELVHCHLAKQPIPPHQLGKGAEEIPEVLSQIVIKLMAKNAEDRYQSALGLKHDLETCLFQWKETGKIEPFELGERDVCDRFLISEKLYGRQTEAETLLAAFERVSTGSTEMILVAGFSGIGKTAVVNEVHKPIVRQRGYFIKGKYDQFQRNIPFSAFVQAFRDLMGQLLSESDAQIEQWKTKILAAIGENGKVLIEVIPELEHIIGEQPAVPELSGSAAQNRFNLVFQKFVQVFTIADHPLVLFLDDLQWADSASLKLMQLLMQDTGHLLVIGAYRDNEVSPVHPFMVTIDAIQQTGATVNTMTLKPLSRFDVNQLIADTLSCELAIAEPLTELVDQKTQGNPFFTTQFLKALHAEKLITFDLEARHWQCDIAQVRAAALTDDVVEFMALQLQKLPPETQEVLKLAACIGAQFDLNTLAIVLEKSQTDTATDLWKALQEGFILPTTEIYKFFTATEQVSLTASVNESVANPHYRFLHDRVQQAAYSLIPESQKQQTHLKVGQLLLNSLDAAGMEEKIFDIVNHFNLAVDLIDDRAEQEQLAQLNLTAGRKAKASTAYEPALKYLRQGIKLLAQDSWAVQYSLTLDLYVQTVELEYLNTNFPEAQALSDVVLEHAQTLLDKTRVYELKVQFYNAQNQMVKGVELGLEVVKQLGVSLYQLPENPDGWTKLPSFADLDQMPTMSDPHKLAALRLLMVINPAAFVTSFTTYAQVILTMVNLCLEHGNSGVAAIAYGHYGLILCGMGDIDAGYHSGQLALKLLEKFRANEFKSNVYCLFNGFTRHWKEHAKYCLLPLLEGIQSGLETGDIEFAGYNTFLYCDKAFSIGQYLETIEQKQRLHIDLMVKFKQEFTIYHNKVWHQLILNFQGLSPEPIRLIGESFDETEMLAHLKATNNGMSLFTAYVAKTMLAYHFGDYAQSLQHAITAVDYAGGGTGTLALATHNLYHSLALLALYPDAPLLEQEQYLEKVAAHQQVMQKWAEYAPMNHLHKYYLVEAERHRVLGNYAEAIAHYDRAISLANENEYVNEEALANELAAKFYLAWGKEKVAQSYIIDAYYAYGRWGAKAKVDDLEQQYPKLLTLILQQRQQSFTSTETIVLHTVSTSTSDSTSLSAALDLGSILKASQALSSEIELEKLLSALLQVVMENAGADRSVLLLPKNDQWVIEAIAQIGQPSIILKSLPLDTNQAIPTSVINRVRHTLQSLVINQAVTHPTFAGDPYFLKQFPQSVLCTPILNQSRLIGILYLENHLTAGAFTGDRIEVLNLLCAQAAISLENARLYQQAQQALTDLQQAQLQIVQGEKMSALGNLVTGVAHEINNPVGFLSGNIKPALGYIQDLFGLIDLYQQKFPNPDLDIQNKIEAIDLNYIRKDLPAAIGSMREGVKRVQDISTSLRTFSRADSDRPIAFNIHDGLDSTILILKHRLKANETRPEIEVIKEYGQLPLVQCFAGQLNQVFMNLLSNAIDAIEDSNQGRSFTEIEADRNQIAIRTSITEDGQQAVIRIQDNGIGMSDEVKQKMFDHLFTTKAVGKGTGLGMAIARSIVVEKHAGTLEVNSTLGQGAELVITLPVQAAVATHV